MYHWVKDKEFLKAAYRECADIVNQFVQNLANYDIEASMNVVGSKSRNMITQNGNEPIDFDFNVVIHNAPNINDCEAIKVDAQRAFDEILERNGWRNCQDSTSALTTAKRRLRKGNQTQFSMDICLIRIHNDQWYRLIHNKNSLSKNQGYCWEAGRNTHGLIKKEEKLKRIPGAWTEVRNTYLEKKNMYLTRNDHNHSSYICYIEAVNEVYYRI